MRTLWVTALRGIGAAAVTWGTSAVCASAGSNRSIASMALLLEILGIATLGDWLLAIVASVAASLAFSWYFIDTVDSFRITSPEGAVTFTMMAVTALTGSHLAVRAQRRAAEAIRRREEMERLQRLGNGLLAANGVAEAAQNAVHRIVELFGVGGAVLRIDGFETPFEYGTVEQGRTTAVRLYSDRDRSALELYGGEPSAEVGSALANLIRLVIDRARAAEEKVRGDSEQRGEELRNTVLNALAHNFRTPLTSIKAAASMLRGSREVTTDHGRELVAVIDEEADRLDELIRESLDLARIEARHVNPRRERYSASEVASRVTSRLARYLGNRELTLDVPETLPLLWGDRLLFEQMLMQVVDNAWKYSKPKASIKIDGRLVKGNIVITVWNEGRQIPDDERDRIFGKFYRGTGNRSQVEGTGLGLAIARAIAEAHGGRIWLDAEPGGPAFRFSLPVKNGDADD